jgi:cyclic-di-GMP phosphodiesterase TipF (flagellum assembly factor)
MLLRRTGLGSDIHPADFSDLLGRFGIDLIAERIENEGTVVDLLDYDVRFGQGFLFSPPRPVRSEVLQGIVERPSMASPGGGRPASELPPVRGPEPLPADAKSSADRRSTMAQLARGTVRRA